jgi:hypothetical protein
MSNISRRRALATLAVAAVASFGPTSMALAASVHPAGTGSTGSTTSNGTAVDTGGTAAKPAGGDGRTSVASRCSDLRTFYDWDMADAAAAGNAGDNAAASKSEGYAMQEAKQARSLGCSWAQ